MEIFLFIFSNLLRLYLRKIKLFAEPGVIHAAGPKLSLSRRKHERHCPNLST